MYVTSKEMDGLEEMNVFSIEEYTINELRRMGIKHAPMPLGLIYDVKQTPAGDWDKDKARLVMRGHRWNMRKSFGFDHTYETYAATPDLSTTRIMQALMVLYGWTDMIGPNLLLCLATMTKLRGGQFMEWLRLLISLCG
eukprot:COSAG06_NODE_21352_length_759_cov_11.963636_1_plen_139_part_00